MEDKFYFSDFSNYELQKLEEYRINLIDILNYLKNGIKNIENRLEMPFSNLNGDYSRNPFLNENYKELEVRHVIKNIYSILKYLNKSINNILENPKIDKDNILILTPDTSHLDHLELLNKDNIYNIVDEIDKYLIIMMNNLKAINDFLNNYSNDDEHDDYDDDDEEEHDDYDDDEHDDYDDNEEHDDYDDDEEDYKVVKNKSFLSRLFSKIFKRN